MRPRVIAAALAGSCLALAAAMFATIIVIANADKVWPYSMIPACERRARQDLDTLRGIIEPYLRERPHVRFSEMNDCESFGEYVLIVEVSPPISPSEVLRPLLEDGWSPHSRAHIKKAAVLADAGVHRRYSGRVVEVFAEGPTPARSTALLVVHFAW